MKWKTEKATLGFRIYKIWQILKHFSKQLIWSHKNFWRQFECLPQILKSKCFKFSFDALWKKYEFDLISTKRMHWRSSHNRIVGFFGHDTELSTILLCRNWKITQKNASAVFLFCLMIGSYKPHRSGYKWKMRWLIILQKLEV